MTVILTLNSLADCACLNDWLDRREPKVAHRTNHAYILSALNSSSFDQIRAPCTIAARGAALTTTHQTLLTSLLFGGSHGTGRQCASSSSSGGSIKAESAVFQEKEKKSTWAV